MAQRGNPCDELTMVIFSGTKEVETDWRRVPALSSRDVRFDASPGSTSGAGVGIAYLHGVAESGSRKGVWCNQSVTGDEEVCNMPITNQSFLNRTLRSKLESDLQLIDEDYNDNAGQIG